ncbi:MAG: hypothetical protein GY724_05020 [Actinomycetia bacterium]|nr:hypothetical protein [Actinomycetes bacterium]
MRKLAVIVVIGLVVAACGSSDADTSSTASEATAEASSTTESATTEVETTTTAAAPTTAQPTTTTTTTTTAAPDVTPPDLSVTHPADGATVAGTPVLFRGTVEPGVEGVWSPPDHEAAVDAAGNWEVAIDLPSGHNDVMFFTLDQAANETIVETSVTYTAPMPCGGMEVQLEHASAFSLGAKDWCGGWGYAHSVDSTEMVFDLIQVDLNVAGDESQGWSFVNANPMLRYLPLSSAIEIRACPPAPGNTGPGSCGSPWVGPESWEFSLWAVADLGGFVAAASDVLWRVLIDPANGEVLWVEQWWTP